MSDSKLLAGVRVIDLSRVLAGPFAAQTLGELGADVIKVESPDGDPARHIGPHRNGQSLYFAALNAGKRSVVLDLGDTGDRARLHRLLDTADVVIENFRPAAARRLGVTVDELRAGRPQLVVVSVPGYARSSDRADDPAYDLVVQADTGIMAVTGEPGGAPVRAGVAIGDLAAGLWAATAACAGLVARARTGEGTAIEVPLHDAALTMLSYLGTSIGGTGHEPGPVGSGHHQVVPYGAFPTADGWIAIAVIGDKFYAPLLAGLGLEGHAIAAYSTNAARLERRDEVEAAIRGALADLTVAEAVDRLTAHGVPHAPVRSVLDALTIPYVQASGQVVTHDVGGGDVPFVRGAVRTGGPPRRAPRLGEHTTEVLAELGG